MWSGSDRESDTLNSQTRNTIINKMVSPAFAKFGLRNKLFLHNGPLTMTKKIKKKNISTEPTRFLAEDIYQNLLAYMRYIYNEHNL